MQVKDDTVGLVGLGAAGIGISKLLKAYGVRKMLGTDINPGARRSSRRRAARPSRSPEVMASSDIVIATTGVPGLIKKEMVRKGQVILALSNPNPEISAEDARAAGASFAVDGRSVNNALAFPGVFRGALNARARKINNRMKIAAAKAISSCASAGELVPSILDREMHAKVAEAVERAAFETGVARPRTEETRRANVIRAMDASWLRGTLLVLFGYLLGSVPFGILVAKAFDRDVDLRKAGSGNIGATNVARTLGRGAGVLTLALDAGKGILALALARQLLDPSAHHWLALVGGAVFLGHIFPVYLRFKGGKGVATALGVVLFLSPETAFVLVALFAAVLYFTRYVSLGSLCAAVGLPVAMAFLGRSRHYLTLALLIAFVVIYTHRENIHRLLAGQESRFGTPPGE